MRKLKFKGTSFDSLMLAAVRIITMLTGILSTMILSHKLDLETYGTYSQGTLIVSLAVSLSICGLADAANYFYNAKEGEEKETYVNSIVRIEFIIGIVLAVAIIIFKDFLCNYFRNQNISVLIAYIAFRPLLENLSNILQILQLSIGRTKVTAIRNLSISILKILLVVLTAFVTNNIKTIFVGYLFFDSVIVIYYWVSFTKRAFFINPFRRSNKTYIKILGYSLPMAVYTLTKTLNKDVDKLFISFFEGTESMAIYSNSSYQLPFDVISNAFLVVIIPIITSFISNRNFEKAKGIFSEYLRIGYMTTCVFAVAVFIVSQEVVLTLFGERYLAGLTVFRIYLIIDMIKFANLSLILSAKGWTKKLMIVSFLSVVLNFILNICLYHLIGFEGPAVASVIVSLVVNIILCALSAKALETNFLELLNKKEIFIFIIEVLTLSAPAFLLRKYLLNINCSEILIIILAGGGYIIALFLVNYKRILSAFKRMNVYKKS